MILVIFDKYIRCYWKSATSTNSKYIGVKFYLDLHYEAELTLNLPYRSCTKSGWLFEDSFIAIHNNSINYGCNCFAAWRIIFKFEREGNSNPFRHQHHSAHFLVAFARACHENIRDLPARMRIIPLMEKVHPGPAQTRYCHWMKTWVYIITRKCIENL